MIRRVLFGELETSFPASAMRFSRAALTAAWVLMLLPTVTVAAKARESSAAPAHLEQARLLVENLRTAELNVYGGGKRQIDWEAGHASARTVCSSFATLLLQHAYGWKSAEIKDRFGSANPEASAYHDAVVGHKKFLRIVHVDKIKPGDFLAIKYTDQHVSRNGVEDTGHVMVVAEAPREIAAHKPLVEGTSQYSVTVIDSSASGHGPTDTRHRPDGTFTGGIGRGVLRIYSDKDGKIAGYTWSDGSKSTFYSSPERDLVAGRIKLTDTDNSGQ